MHVGEEATVTCPPSLAYGSVAQGPIPPNSVLYFDMEVMDCETTFWALFSKKNTQQFKGLHKTYI